MEKFPHLEALLFTAVLENCVEQLAILEHTMPVSYEGKTELSHTGSQELKESLETQKEPDMNSQELMSARQGSKETATSTALKSSEHKQQLGKTEDLRSARRLSKRAVKHSALSVENLRKIQADRQYASDVITATMKKMQESGTFNSLTEANEREKAKKSKFHDVLTRDEELKTEIKALEKQLQDVKKETETELQGIWGILDVSDLLHKCRTIECSTSLVTAFTKQLRPDAERCLRAKARAVLYRSVETQPGPAGAGACDRKQARAGGSELYKDWKKEQESDTWFSTEHEGIKGIRGKNQYP